MTMSLSRKLSVFYLFVSFTTSLKAAKVPEISCKFEGTISLVD